MINDSNKGPFSNLDKIILNTMQNNSSESIYFKDVHSRFILLSKFQLDNFGAKSMEECYGKTDFDYFTKEHAQQAFNDELEIMRTGTPIIGKIEQETWEGNYVSYVISSKYPLYDENNKIIGTWGHSTYISKSNNNEQSIKLEKAKVEQLNPDFSKDSRIDALTNLKNTKAFYEVMNLFYQEAMNTISVPGKEHILLLVDMNDFNAININFGHKYSDKALSFASMLLNKIESPNVHLFRYGGDEFAILIDKSTYDDAINIAKEILAVFAKHPFKSNKDEIFLTASIGISRFKESLPFGNIHDIINLTDKRLYAAKKVDVPTIIFDNSYRL